MTDDTRSRDGNPRLANILDRIDLPRACALELARCVTPRDASTMHFRYRGHDLEIRPLAHLASGWIDGTFKVYGPNAAAVVRQLLAELSDPSWFARRQARPALLSVDK